MPRSARCSIDSTIGRSRSCRDHAAAMFEALDRPAMRALPTTPYVYAEWKRVRGRLRLPRRCRPALLQRPARARRPGACGRASPPPRSRCSTAASGSRAMCAPTSAARTRRYREHMPKSHRAHARVVADAPDPLGRLDRHEHRRGGRASAASAKPHPEQGYRACLGLSRLAAAVREGPASRRRAPWP